MKKELPDAKDKPLKIVFSDENIIVVNKPGWLLSVPGDKYEKEDSVVQRLAKDFGKIHVAHRLDCATSGLMVLARNLASEIELHRQFREREVEKIYHALVTGTPSTSQGEIDVALSSDRENLPKQKIDLLQGKKSFTQWRLLKTDILFGQEVSLLELVPTTGRRHQLRLHLKYIGHAIVGDRLYSSPNDIRIDKMYLHASSLRFKDPDSQKKLVFTSRADFM